ncbi:MAG: methyltransferase domain-containing protein [Bacteroidales bacterium]|nr:methyltransferase domain-containing protein [Bacteroidales bacterium]
MSQLYEYPDYFARFYDIIYHQLRSHVDARYFLSKIKSTRGSILEIGVGTGRFFTEALGSGADIYGIDISKSMVDVLKNKLDPSEHYRIYTGDACTMKLDRRFSLIIAPFRVFSHVIDVTDQIKFLNNVWEHLDDEGKFIFDLFIPDPGKLQKGMDKVVDFEGEYEPGKKLRRTVSTSPDIVNQILDISMNFEWEDNNKWLTKTWKIKFRIYFRYELEHLITLSRLKLENISGDYKGGSLSKNSKEFVVVCRK